jgi:hypothetical protein
MASFTDYKKYIHMKFPIYFTSHMCIAGQIMDITLE